MKTIEKILGLLPMTVAALMLTACSSDDDLTMMLQAQTIHYSVSVSKADAETRATVGDDMKTLKFASGDKLYVTGTNIKGVLTMKSEAGATTATFEGDLTYSGEGTPATDLTLTATLVSAQQAASITTTDQLVTIDAAGAVAVNYPTASFCSDVSDAVQKYSNLTGISTYGARSFTLTQQTAFLNFALKMEDGTEFDSDVEITVKNGATTLSTATVRTTADAEDNIYAIFVLPVAASTQLDGATVTAGDSNTPISFGSSSALTLEGKVYNIKRTVEGSFVVIGG